MSYESPYQAMLENELLFQQQPWLHRAPYQALNAVRPVSTGLTGLGAGAAVGKFLGHPGIGATLGALVGTAYGVLSPQASPAQQWAFNNPEKVHVLRARAAYDYDHGGVPPLGEAAHLAKVAALRDYGIFPR